MAREEYVLASEAIARKAAIVKAALLMVLSCAGGVNCVSALSIAKFAPFVTALAPSRCGRGLFLDACPSCVVARRLPIAFGSPRFSTHGQCRSSRRRSNSTRAYSEEE